MLEGYAPAKQLTLAHPRICATRSHAWVDASNPLLSEFCFQQAAAITQHGEALQIAMT
jgi:hypothetical protein